MLHLGSCHTHWPACRVDFWSNWWVFVCLLQGALTQISTRTTWSMAPTITGYPHRSRSPPARLRAPIRTVGRLRRSSCWCVTEPALDSRDAGIQKHSHHLKTLPQRILNKTDAGETVLSLLSPPPPTDLVIHLFCIWSVRWRGMCFRRRSWRRWGTFCALESLCRYVTSTHLNNVSVSDGM